MKLPIYPFKKLNLNIPYILRLLSLGNCQVDPKIHGCKVYIEATLRRCSCEKVFLKQATNLQENTRAKEQFSKLVK